MQKEYIYATYHLSAPAAEAESLADAVLLEQTVETPYTVARRDPFVRQEMLGERLSLTPAPAGGFLTTLALPTHTAATDPAQFLNVIFGNSSLHPQVALVDVTLPPKLLTAFPGPAFGIAGLRALANAWDRPLTCAALKPVGLNTETLAACCATFAAGGIDFIKDDHYLADHPFSPFAERVQACLAATDAVAQRTGHKAIYVPNLSGTPDEVLRQYDVARAAGAEAVMVAPLLLGLPFVHRLVQHDLEVPLLAHPSFAGATRIDPIFLFGKLLRLFGADAVIFVNYGGRFSYPKATCLAIAETLRRTWSPLRPTMPVPAGGMQVARTPELVEAFGCDTMLLIGGSLLEAEDLHTQTRAFTDQVRASAQALGFSKPTSDQNG